MEDNENMNNTEITNGTDIEKGSNSAENAVNENTEKFEKIEKKQYTAADTLKETVGTFFPFIKNKRILGTVAFVIIGAFFLLPAILSILALLEVGDYSSMIATHTSEAMKLMVKIVIVFLAWAGVGTVLGWIVNKKVCFGYNGFGDFVKRNIVRIMLCTVLIIMTVSSYFISDNVNASFTNLTDGMYVWYAILCGGICATMIKRKKQKRALLVMFVVAALILSCEMYVQYVTKYRRIELSQVFTVDMSAMKSSAVNLRHVRGIFANSNHCGYYLTIATMCAAGLLITSKKWLGKLMWGISLAVLINAVILNDTLGSVLAVFVTILLTPIAFIHSEHRVITRFIPILILVVVTAFVSLFPSLPTGSRNITTYAKEISGIFSKIAGNDDSESKGNDDGDSDLQKSTETSGNVQASNGNLDSASTLTVPKGRLNESDNDSENAEASEGAPISEVTSSNAASDSAQGNVSHVIFEDNKPVVSAPPYTPIKNGWWLKNQSVGTGRLGLWQFAIELIRQRPLLGYGCNGAADRFTYQSGLASPAVRVHNEYLQVALDYGIPACIIYLAALLITVICFFKRLKKKDGLSPVARILFIAFAAYCISAFSGIAAYYTVSYFFIMFALLLSEFEGAPEPEPVPVAMPDPSTNPIYMEMCEKRNDIDADKTETDGEGNNDAVPKEGDEADNDNGVDNV